MTLVAALATVVVILGIATGPMAISCAGSGDGFGACMRDRLADMGLAKQQPAPISTPTEQSANAVTPSAPDAADDTPSPTPATPSEAKADVVAQTPNPRIGLVRAEPDGSLVVAGSAAPDADVDVYANGELLGTTTAESNGDWVLVPDKPLPPGGVEITVGMPATGQTAQQSVVVVIQDDKKTEPLVVASTPGEASNVLQGLTASETAKPETAAPEAANAEATTSEATRSEAPEPETGQQITSTEPAPAMVAGADENGANATDGTPASQNASSPTPTPSPQIAQGAESSTDTVVGDLAEAAPQAAGSASGARPGTLNGPVASPDASQAGARDDASGGEGVGTDSATTAEETAPRIALVQPQDNGLSAPSATSSEAPVTAQAETRTPAPTRNDTKTGVAKLDEPVEAPAAAAAPPATLTPPSIDAIEVDGERNFFAGGGAEGATVRLYVDNNFVADTVVQGGRWLIETGKDFLTKPEQRVRVDMLKPGAADVVGRAEVNFEIDLPAPMPPDGSPEPGTAIASSAPSGGGTGREASAPNAGQAAETSDETASEKTPAVAAGSEPASDIASASSPQNGEAGTKTQVAETAPVAEGSETGSGEAENIAPDTTEPPAKASAAAGPSAEGPVAAVADEGGTATPAANDDVPVMTAVQVGNPEDMRFASGKAIIRRGDNLWTIAKRVYGEGIRYTTIYQANKAQIRDPDLIYPGQVFGLPASDGDDAG